MKLKNLFWDYDFTEEELQRLLSRAVSRVGHLDRSDLYARILSSYPWYEVLDLVGQNNVDELLSDSVVGRIFSKDLKRKYGIVKRVLSQ